MRCSAQAEQHNELFGTGVSKAYAMVRKKYIRDYRIVERVDEGGRLRSDYEYIGGDYVYELGAEAVGREKRLVLAAVAAGWLAYLGALLPNAAGMHALYVALPFLFSAVPLGILTDIVFTALPGREPLRHEQADRLANTYPPAALFAAVLPGASMIGEGIAYLRGAPCGGQDVVFTLCAAALAACAGFAFSRRERFACRKK